MTTTTPPTWVLKYIHKSKVNAVKIVTWKEHHEVATIRDVFTWNGQPSDGAKNAALISSAPELLHILDTLLNVDDDGDGFICSEAMDQVRAAIAKAKGL